MNLTENEPWMERGACRTRTDLFASAALDYKPGDEDYAHLTEAEHAEAAAEKARVEQATVNVCMGCPALFECEAWALDKGEVFGVAGGRTESERAEMAAANGGIATAAEEAEPVEATAADVAAEIAMTPRDRGARDQINDTEVERLTRLNKTAGEIAHEMQCSERSVVRARARIKKARRIATEAAQAAVVAEAVAIVAQADAAIVAEADAAIVAEVAPAARTRGAREASDAMNAIYTVLADGQWHQRDELLEIGVERIPADEALAWWIRTNQVNTPNGKVLNPNKADTSTQARIVFGARDKVNNMLSASCRNRKNTERGGPTCSDRDLYRLTAKAVAGGIGQREAVAA